MPLLHIINLEPLLHTTKSLLDSFKQLPIIDSPFWTRRSGACERCASEKVDGSEANGPLDVAVWLAP